MNTEVQVHQNTVSDTKENLSHSLESWKQIEDLIFQVNEENITETSVVFISGFNNISVDSVLNLIIYVSKVRPFAFKPLGNLFKELFISKNTKFPKKPFTLFLYSLGILLDSNFFSKPKDIGILEEFERIFQVGSISHCILNDKIEEISLLTTSFDVKEYKIRLFKKYIVCIDFASFCGSINVFKYLCINGCDITSLTTEWSIKGGHYNIVQLIEQNGFSFDNHLVYATKYHHHHLFDWLIKHCKSKDILLQNCIKWWNTTIFERIVNKGRNIESEDGDSFENLF